MRVALVVLALLALGYVGLLAYLGAASRRPRPTTPTAPRDGELRPCRRATNCVCSQPGCGGRQVAPLAFTGPPEVAIDRLAAVLAALPRTSVVERDGGYLRAEARSRVFGFVDDFEARLDAPAGKIHVRSASRVGLADRGVNARRVTLVRERFAAGEGGGSGR
jgi:uncharacterized protein (DUF1499 family)